MNQRSQSRRLAERLGFSPDAKLLIIHADDLGMTHSVNMATRRAFEAGIVNSASVMVPAPYFPEVVACSRQHPKVDLGIHLTLTSEWKGYRWKPVAPLNRVQSLVDGSGHMYQTEQEVAAHLDPEDAEVEVQHQVEKALGAGLKPTHLDSHMYALFQTGELFQVLLRAGARYNLPVLIARDFLEDHPFLQKHVLENQIPIQRLIAIGPETGPEAWQDFYDRAIESLEPGITQITVHLAYDDEEMRAVTRDRVPWGSAWRQRDLDYFTSPNLGTLLTAHRANLITWRQISRVLGHGA